MEACTSKIIVTKPFLCALWVQDQRMHKCIGLFGYVFLFGVFGYFMVVLFWVFLFGFFLCFVLRKCCENSH